MSKKSNKKKASSKQPKDYPKAKTLGDMINDVVKARDALTDKMYQTARYIAKQEGAEPYEDIQQYVSAIMVGAANATKHITERLEAQELYAANIGYVYTGIGERRFREKCKEHGISMIRMPRWKTTLTKWRIAYLTLFDAKASLL